MLDRDEAFRLATQRDKWIWLKGPVWLALAVMFYAEQLWKAATLFIGSGVCAFVMPCVDGASDVSLWIAFLMRAGLIAAVTGYVSYTLAWLSLPGWRNKLLAFAGVVLFIPGFLLVPLAVALLLEKGGMPWNAIWAFEARWVPLDAWKGAR